MILTIPDKRLRIPGKPVPQGLCVRAPINRLSEALGAHLGIAANQLGCPWRIAIIGTELGNIVMVNPEIVQKSMVKATAKESCLSVPGASMPVSRHLFVTVEYFDAAWKKHSLKATGLTARIVQHEIDHLDGILLTDRAP